MGVVVEATHVQLDERVALKFLRPEMLAMPDVVARFDREARAAVKLKSDHVARVIDVGKTQAGVPYMVMEFLDGKDLGETLAEQGPLPVSQAVEYIIQACEGIGEAHARGIVHRDVKPENLFLVKRDDGWRSVKVLDFGISKAVLVGPSSVDMSSKDTSAIMGSPHYMSPEQLRSTKSVDHRADVWSLGVVLFELLAGTMPFDETLEFTELVAHILEIPHRRLRDLRGDAPIMLEAVVDRALEKDRARRYQSAAELAVALLPFAPKRARATVERVTSITKAAGLTDPSFQIPPSDLPPGSAEAMAALPTMAPPRMPNVTPAQSPMTTSNPAISGAVETSMPPKRRLPIAAIAAGGVALLALLAITAYGLSHASGAKTATSATASAPVTTPATQSIATAPKKPMRRVLVIDPREAIVTVDGVRLSKDTPWVEGTRSVLLHVEAVGREPRDLTVTFETDEPLVIELPRIATTATTTAVVAPVVTTQRQPRAHASASAAASSAPPPTATESPTDVGY
jgi:serine/threonine-protein kinase